MAEVYAVIGANTASASPTIEAVRATREEAKEALVKTARDLKEQLETLNADEEKSGDVILCIGDDDASVINECDDIEFQFVVIEVPTSPSGNAYARKLWE